MTTELAIREHALPAPDDVNFRLGQVAAMQRMLRDLLTQGTDYGVIPGTRGKPTLLKPGAEKVRLAFALADKYEITRDTELEAPHRGYEVQCLIADQQGVVVASGVGYCTTMESRYRYRWQGSGADRHRGENPDIADTYNTVLKIAKKRALVDAMLSIAALSEIFTQDIEDMAQNEDAAEQRTRRAPPAQRNEHIPTTLDEWQTLYNEREQGGAKPETLARIASTAAAAGFGIATTAKFTESEPEPRERSDEEMDALAETTENQSYVDSPLDALGAWVESHGYALADVGDVLKMPWDEWVKLIGDPAQALDRAKVAIALAWDIDDPMTVQAEAE